MIRYAAVLFAGIILSLSHPDLNLATEVSKAAGSSQQDQSFDLVNSESLNDVLRVNSTISIRGKVFLDSTDEAKSSFPLKVENKYQFDERFLNQHRSKSVRNYQTAQSVIEIGSGHRKNELTAENGLIIFHHVPQDLGIKNWSITTSGKPLEESQYDMIATPFNNVVFNRLVSRRNVKKGETWQPDDQLLAEAVLIDAVHVNNVEIKVLGQSAGKVQLSVGGQTEGLIDGARTTISLTGSATFDTQAGRLSSFRISMNEERAASQAAPGYQANIELESKIVASPNPAVLSSDKLKSLTNQVARNGLLFESKSGKFNLNHDRAWKIVSDQGKAVTMRLISGGDPIAQCTIFDLPNLPANQPLAVSNFRQLVTEMVTDESIGIDKIQEAFSPEGNHILRVSAQGKQESVELRWTYYHVANTQGQRLLFIFTMEQSLTEDVGAADQNLVESVIFNKEKRSDVAEGQPESTKRR